MNSSTSHLIPEGISSSCHDLTIPDALTIRIKLRFLEKDLSCTIARLPFEFIINISKKTDTSASSVVAKISQVLEQRFGAVEFADDPATWLFWKLGSTNIFKSGIFNQHGDFKPVRITGLSNQWPYVPLFFIENKKKKKWWGGYGCGGLTAEAVLSFAMDPPPLHSLMHLIYHYEVKKDFEKRQRWTAGEMSDYAVNRSSQIEWTEKRVLADSEPFMIDGTRALSGPRHVLWRDDDSKRIVALYQEKSGELETGLTLFGSEKKWGKYFVKRSRT